MKIRLGFVSNSSTSSFCIYGVFFDENSIEFLTNKFNIPTSPEVVKVNGCYHTFDRIKDHFCSICGKASYIVKKLSTEEIFNAKFDYILKKLPKGISGTNVTYAQNCNDGFYFGKDLNSNTTTTNPENFIQIIKDTVKDIESTFGKEYVNRIALYSGTYGEG